MLAKIKEKMAALPPIKIDDCDYAAKGYHLNVQVEPEQVVAAASILGDELFTLEAVTGVDFLKFEQPKKKKPAKKDEDGTAAAAAEPVAEEPEEKLPPQMEVVYDYSHTDALCRVVVRARIPRDTPQLPTISAVFSGANWHERETHDFFGIKFTGHPDLSPLLLPEDADFHPLRKDFKA